MANKKITDIDTITSINDTDKIVMTETDTSVKRISYANLMKSVNDKIKENTEQLNDNVNEIESVKTDYAKKTDVNSLVFNKAEKSDLEIANSNITKNATEIEAQKVIVNSLTKLGEGSTTGDAELIAGRTGYNGVTYENIGDEIRTQFMDVNEIINDICPNFYPKNITDGLIFKDGYYDAIQNKVIVNSDYKHAVIKVTRGDVLIYNGKACWDGRLYVLVKNGAVSNYYPSSSNNNSYWGEKIEITEACDLYLNTNTSAINDTILYKMSKSSNVDICDNYSFNIIDSSKWEIGYLRTTSKSSFSVINKDNTFVHLSYLTKCNLGDVLYVKYRYYSIMFYDEYFRLIEQFITTPNCYKEVPAGSKYVGIYVGENDKKDDQVISINNKIPSLFVPYGSLKNYAFKSESEMRRGVKWVAFGDSLTDKATLSKDTIGTKNYVDFVSEALALETTNCGIGGTGYIANNGGNSSPFIDRINTIPNDTNVITVFGSFNDLYHNPEIGTINDAPGVNTLYGKFKEFIEALFVNYPDAIIGLITPSPWGKACRANTTGEKHSESIVYVNALIETAKYYSLPLLNLYDGSGLRPWVKSFLIKYYRNSDGSDDVHPNQEGHRKYIAQKVKVFLEGLIAQ